MAVDNSAKATSSKADDNRRLRNRLSQKAFRARQAMRIKELEGRIEAQSNSASDWTIELQEKNTALRNNLLDCHKKLMSLQVTIRDLAETTGQYLGVEISDAETGFKPTCERCAHANLQQMTPPSEDHLPHPRRSSLGDASSNSQSPINHGLDLINSVDFTNNQTSRSEVTINTGSHVNMMQDGICSSPNNWHSLNAQAWMPAASIQEKPNYNLHQSEQYRSNSVHTVESISASDLNPEIANTQLDLMRIDCHSLQPDAYSTLLLTCPKLDNQLNGVRKTNSNFSDHLTAIEEIFVQQLFSVDAYLPHKTSEAAFDDRMTNCLQHMIWTFVTVSWDGVMDFYKVTKSARPLKQLCAWRMKPILQNYLAVLPAYRPTKLQMSIPHPGVIDWIPWPSMRDSLILLHSTTPDLDSLIQDIGNSYVVPADISDLLVGYPPTLGFVGVWDIVRVLHMDDPSTRSQQQRSYNLGTPFNDKDFRSIFDQSYEHDEIEEDLPAQSVEALFSSKSLAKKAFKLLNMDRGATSFLIDPSLFVRYPELCEGQANIIAQGIGIRDPSRTPFPLPKALDVEIVQKYRNAAASLINSQM